MRPLWAWSRRPRHKFDGLLPKVGDEGTSLAQVVDPSGHHGIMVLALSQGPVRPWFDPKQNQGVLELAFVFALFFVCLSRKALWGVGIRMGVTSLKVQLVRPSISCSRGLGSFQLVVETYNL